MTTHMAHSGERSWLGCLKEAFARLFSKPEPIVRTTPPSEMERPIPSEEMVDEASEDSFPASDPPSYTGTTT